MNKPSISPPPRILTRKSAFCLAAFLLAGLSAFAASAMADVVYNPFVKVDVNSGSSATMTGYDALNFTNSVTSQTVNYAPGISVTAAHETGASHRNRSANDGGDALTSDFIYETTKPVTVTITGLEVGKEYSLKLFSHDTNANTGTSSTWTITQGENISQIGSITNTVDKNHATSTDPATYLAYTFKAEANTAVITGSSTNFVSFNGLDLSEESAGLTRFDINGDAHLTAVRSTELYFPDNTQNSATATAPSGITMTVSCDSNLSSRTRGEENANMDMRMYKDFIFSSNNSPITTTLENLKSDAIYRLTVYTIDPHLDQSAGIWTMTDANGKTLFNKDHATTKSDTSTWSFDQYFKPATSTVTMEVVKGSKALTMFNGLQLQEISPDTADYTWVAGRAGWLAENKWQKKGGTEEYGTPVAGDICYVDASGVSSSTDYWLNASTDPFDATLVLKGANAQIIIASNITANDLILDGGCLHHGAGDKTYTLNGNLGVVNNSTIDLDDGGNNRTLQIAAAISGNGNLNVAGMGAAKSALILTNSNTDYIGKFILNKATLTLSGSSSSVGAGDLDIPETSQLTLSGPNYGLHYVSNLTGSGPISVTATSRFDLASSDPQDYSGTISIATDKQLHVGYTISGDKASDVSLPNATVSLASGAHLGIIHEDGSTKAGSLVIGTLNSSESNSVVRSSGSVNTNKKVYGTVTVGKGDFAGTIIGQLRLVKNTNGTLTLSGINTYAGGTDIQAGKIVLTGKGTLGSGAVTIGENGTLEFNVAEGDPKKMTISSTITSAGKITKTGDGTLQLCTAAEGLVNASSFVVSSGRLDMKEYFSGTLEIGDGAEKALGKHLCSASHQTCCIIFRLGSDIIAEVFKCSVENVYLYNKLSLSSSSLIARYESESSLSPLLYS